MKKRYVSTFLILYMGSINAFIYQVQVMRKWDKRHNAYQYVIGCGDWHDKTDEATQEQREYLERILKRCDPKTTQVIVEDLSSDEKGKQARCRSFVVNTRGGILGGLARVCRDYDLPVENVEYRYCRVAALGPLLRTPSIDLNTYASTRTISVSDMLKEVQKQIEKAQQFDTPKLAPLVRETEKKLAQERRRLHLDQHQSASMADYIEKHSKVDTRFDLLKSMLIFDSSLIDLKMVHIIANAKDKHTILIIAGGTHINQTNELLQKFGYERVYVSPMQFIYEYDLNKCLGAHIIDGAYCERPRSVSLELVEYFALLK